MAQQTNPTIAQLYEQRSEALLKVLPAFQYVGLPCKLIKDQDDYQVDFGDARIWIDNEVASFFLLKAGDFIKIFVRELEGSPNIHVLAGPSPAGEFFEVRASEEHCKKIAKVITWYLKTYSEIATSFS